MIQLRCASRVWCCLIALSLAAFSPALAARRAGGTGPAPAVSVAQEVARLWKQLDRVDAEESELALRRWKALSPVEQAKLILDRPSSQPYSDRSELSLTEQKARGLVNYYARLTDRDGRAPLRGVMRRLLTSKESQAFSSRRTALREAAFRRISELDERAAPALVAIAVSGAPHSSDATEALTRMGAKATPALLAALEAGPPPQAQRLLFWCLAEVKDPRAMGAFMRAIDDRDSTAHGTAMAGLVGLGQTEAVREGLLHALKNEDRYVRVAAIRGLAEFGDAPGVREALLQALNDDDLSIRSWALNGLEQLGPVPQEVYLHALEYAGGRDAARIIEELGKTGDAAAIPVLEEIARCDLTGPKTPESRLEGVASAPAPHLRPLARAAVQQIAARTGAKVSLPTTPEAPPQGRYWSFEELAAATQCRNARIRAGAIGALGRYLHQPEALALVRGAIERDPNRRVRMAAISALSGMFRDRGYEGQRVGPALARQPLSLSSREAEGVFDLLLGLTHQDDEEISYRALIAMRRLTLAMGVGRCISFRHFPEYLEAGLELAEEHEGGRLRLGDAVQRDGMSPQKTGMLIVGDLGYSAPEALDRLLAPDRRADLVARLVAGLVAGLRSVDPDTVRVCIDTLGALRERSAVPQLIDCLHDQFEFYRYYAIKALGHIGDMRALPALQQAAEFDVSRVTEVELRRSEVDHVVLRDVAKEAVEEVRAAQHAPPAPG